MSKPPSFEEARDELNHDLAAEIIDAKLQELRGAAKIETFGLDGKPLPATLTRRTAKRSNATDMWSSGIFSHRARSNN